MRSSGLVTIRLEPRAARRSWRPAGNATALRATQRKCVSIRVSPWARSFHCRRFGQRGVSGGLAPRRRFRGPRPGFHLAFGDCAKQNPRHDPAEAARTARRNRVQNDRGSAAAAPAIGRNRNSRSLLCRTKRNEPFVKSADAHGKPLGDLALSSPKLNTRTSAYARGVS
jgi:hypothetical protein